MKKGALVDYLPDVFRTGKGESYSKILYYFAPEVVTAFLLYSALSLVDSYFIRGLSSTSAWGGVGYSNALLHNIVKLAEGFSVGATVIIGRLNGMREYHEVGKALRDTFWLTLCLGLIFASFFYGGAYLMYYWHDMPPSVIAYGIPFLRLRAFGLVFSFIYLGFFGFLRGIKNTTVPMISFVVGAVVFVITDYLLVPGNLGFPKLGLQGSAIASLVQGASIIVVLLFYIFFTPSNRKFLIHLFEPFKQPHYFKDLFLISMPIAIDKAVFAFSYVWMQSSVICSMGKYWMATDFAVREVGKVAIVPALALAQVITLLVSNDWGRHNYAAIKSNIWKVMLLAFCTVAPILLVFSWKSSFIFSFFDNKGKFTGLAADVFPYISIFMVFDLLQLILSGALRGAGDVRTVMWTRIGVCALYFWPLSYVVGKLPLQNQELKFLMAYGIFYGGHALMATIYLIRLRGNWWKIEPKKELNE